MRQNSKSLAMKLTIAFAAVLLFLTFFSNTIYSLNLPGVVIALPSTGVITNTYRSTGSIDFAESISIFAEDGGRIIITVQEGDRINEGDLLFSIHADDIEGLEDRLEAEQDRLNRINLNLARTRDDLAFEQNRLRELSADTLRPVLVHAPDISRFDFEERRIDAEIERAQTDYQNHLENIERETTRLDFEIERAREDHQLQLTLFNAGAAPQINVTNAANRLEQLIESRTAALASLDTQANQIINNINRLIENQGRNTEERERILQDYRQALERAQEDDQFNLEQQTTALERERQSIGQRIEGLHHSIRLLEMEATETRRAQSRIRSQIEEDGVLTEYAEFSGIVREIPSNLESGMFVERNRIIMRVSPMEIFPLPNDYIVTAYFPETMGTLPSNAQVRINIPSLSEHGIQGQVQRTIPTNRQLRLEIAFETITRIIGGERAEITIGQSSQLFPNTLPNSAIREDAMGHYLLYIAQESNAFFGYSYFARQVRITVLEEGDHTTSFEMLEEIEEPIIIGSDRQLASGDRVRLVGER